MSGGGGQSTPSSTVTTQNLPPFLEAAYQKAIDRADAASREQLPTYQGQRIANFSAPTLQSQNLAQSSIGQYNPTYQAGVDATTAASKPFDAATFAQFNDPYKTQVTDEMARLGNRNFNDNIMPSVNSQFTGNGMFGSSRNAKVLGDAARDTQMDITGKQAEYLSSGFGKSMADYQAAMGRQMAGGAQLGNQAKQGQEMTTADVAALNKTGAEMENKTQQGLDIGYNTFLEQRDQPRNDITFYSNIARGIPTQGLTTTSTQNIAGSGNPIANAIGTAGSLYQAGQLGSKTYAKGGIVKAKKAKGKIPAGAMKMNKGIGSLMYG